MGNTIEMSKDVRKIVAVAIFLIALIILGDIVTGAVSIRAASPLSVSGCNNPSTLLQCGFTSCTMSTVQTFCTSTITFPTPFASKPRVTSVFNSTMIATPFGLDPNITIIHDNNVVFQAYNSTTWKNMTTSGPVELNNFFSQELSIPTLPTSATNIIGMVCVNVIEPSQNSTAIVNVQFNTNNTIPKWTDFMTSPSGGPAGAWVAQPIGAGTGIHCGANDNDNTNLGDPILNFPTSNSVGLGVYVRIVGRWGAANQVCLGVFGSCLGCQQDNGNGLGIDCPQLGDIQFLVSYTIANYTVADFCWPTYTALSTTSVSLVVRCRYSPSVSFMFTIDWKAQA